MAEVVPVSESEKAGVARKREIVDAFARTLADAEAVVVAENAGLTAGEMAELRDNARARGGRAQVVKNTLARRALANTPFAPLAEQLRGPLIYGAGPDAPALAKIFRDLAADDENKIIVRAGMLKSGDAALDAKAVETLASLPGRDELLAKLAGTMQAPAAKLVRTLNEIPSRLARTLAAVRDSREAGGTTGTDSGTGSTPSGTDATPTGTDATPSGTDGGSTGTGSTPSGTDASPSGTDGAGSGTDAGAGGKQD